MSAYLIWSNQKTMWWRASRSGYTPVIEEAGHYTRAEAEEIVRSSTCDGQLKHHREDPVSGAAYVSFDEVMVLAPEAAIR
jgi:hypothetical protein